MICFLEVVVVRFSCSPSVHAASQPSSQPSSQPASQPSSQPSIHSQLAYTTPYHPLPRPHQGQWSGECFLKPAMAIPVFPDQNLSSFVKGFIQQLEEDFQSPSISKFQDYMPKCRAGLQTMEEVSALERDSSVSIVMICCVLEPVSGQESGAQADWVNEGVVPVWGG